MIRANRNQRTNQGELPHSIPSWMLNGSKVSEVFFHISDVGGGRMGKGGLPTKASTSKGGILTKILEENYPKTKGN